ncbi:Fanconi anemia group M protein, partial [Scomber scombrus]
PDEPFIYSHPKLEKLEEVVLQHFRLWADSSADNNGSHPQEVSTRVMIFSSFRESVQEIAAMLNCHAPLIRVMTFMGQASAGKGVKGFTQKEQLEVVQKFRQGGFNTLVSTCVGEEGLDIGEVDLIVCFDAQKNPIRLVQRMGRTGRKRKGRIVIILAEGREERTYNQSQSNKRSIYKSIVGKKSGFHMYPNSPRMLPEGVNPTLHKMHITCGQFDHQENSRRSIRGRRSHSEGRASLIHPQNLIRQGSAMCNGFLSSTEYSLWASSMRLEEDEAHPTLKQSHFMSLPSDPPPQEEVSKSGPPSRELSLWEWRHWQHKALPTHVVDHSLRCQNFIKVMGLIDAMREENEGECRYEQELLPYLSADGHVMSDQTEKKKRQRSTKTNPRTASNKSKPSHKSLSDLECIDEETTRGMDFIFTSVSKKHKPLVEHENKKPHDDLRGHAICTLQSNNDCPVTDVNDDCAFVSEDNTKAECTGRDTLNLNNISQVFTRIDETEPDLDEDVELQAMFYLPKWDLVPPSSTKLLPGRDEGLKAILANVADLLSRSPPLLTVDIDAAMASPSPPPSPQRVQGPLQPFQVSFTLDMDNNDDNDDDEVMMSDADDADGCLVEKEDNKICHNRQSVNRGSTAADSPTWDEVFDEEERESHDGMEIDDEMCNDVLKEQAGEEADKGGGKSEETENYWEGVRGDVRDESMDLFEDDEAFLQMTIPEIPTPEHSVMPRTPPSAEDNSKSTKNMLKTSDTCTNPCSTTVSTDTHVTQDTITHNITETEHHTHTAAPNKHATDKAITSHCKSPTMQQNAESFDNSRDYFPVNFDLGYTLEDSDEEEDVVVVPAPCTSPNPKKQADPTVSLPGISKSSTPYNSFHRPKHYSECKLSTSESTSEHRKKEMSSLLISPLVSKDGPLPSPITSPEARRMLMSGPAGPRTPSSPSILKRRRPEGWTTEAETGPDTEKSSRQELVFVSDFSLHPVECNTDSEEEVVVHKRKHQNKINPLMSPQMSKISSDVDSPVVANRKRVAALNTSDETEGEAVSDDDFQNDSVFTRRTTAHSPEKQRVQQGKTKHNVRRKVGRQFLDEEAELSEVERDEVSSDEEDGDELNHSLDGFVVNNTHFSQGLNDSEMQGVYLKSVRSPAVGGKYKMSYRNHHNMDIFSQVPEMDETYAEDSFVVGSEEELESSEEEAEEEAIELMPEDSYVEGKRQYATRRRVFLHKARAKTGAGAVAKTKAESPPEQRAGVKTKRTRVIRVTDSSEEETGDIVEEKGSVTGKDVAVTLQPKPVQHDSDLSKQKPSSSSSSTLASKVSLLSRGQRGSMTEDLQNERCRQRFENQHLLSNQLDFVESDSLLSSKKQPQEPPATSQPARSIGQAVSVSEDPAPPAPICILVDSRCLSTAVELMTSLRQRHAATVHVCSLDGSYFIVSNRMAVERHSQSDLAAMQNRKRLAERVNSLQGLFERICLIVEKDRTKPGEAARPFQRTRYYDSTLASLVRTGVRLLWSDGAEESAGLLADLARLEQRKGQGITAPLEVKGQHRQQARQLYLSLPSVNYVHALNMSHNFKSIAQLMNSSIEGIQKGGCMSRPRAEEIYRFLRYSCDSFLMSTSKAGNTC